ncbi:MAG: DUF2115 domain-containing protein [Methanoregula sp.]
MMSSDQLASAREKEQICSISRQFAAATTKGELGTLIARETAKYSLADLQVLGGRLYAELVRLPASYRNQVQPYFIEQIFGAHHALLTMYRNGSFGTMTGPITDRETFSKFCEMIPRGCFAWDEQAERTPFPYSPKHRMFYYLMAAFTMFVLDRPGHPVGMPFPGGFAVEERRGTFYCLIRDREKEVFFSICNFCPALQTEENAPSPGTVPEKPIKTAGITEIKRVYSTFIASKDTTEHFGS